MFGAPTRLRLLSRSGFLGLLIAIRGAEAQPVEIWRYFTSADGLVESYVGAVSSGAGGRVWITHGQVPNMSAFDGFSVQRLPSPGIDTRVEEGAAGELWALDIGPGRVPTGLKVFSGGEWRRFPVFDFGPADPELLVTAAGAERLLPFATGRALYLAKDGLREFEAAAGRSKPIRIAGCELGALHSLKKSKSFGFWLAGQHGIGRVSTWPSVDASVPCQVWGHPVPGGGNDFSNLFEDGDSTFASARAGQDSRIVIRAARSHTEVLARTAPGENGICGWSAGNGAAWILRVKPGEQHLFIRSARGDEAPATKSKVLSGRITDIAAEPAGVSWISSVLGLARVAPPIWQPVGPPVVSDQRITSIAETPDKDLVLLGANTLWIHSGGQWLARVLPLAPRLNAGFSNRMAVLENDKIAIPVRPPSGGGPARLLVYDRRLDRFDVPAVPGYGNCAFVAPRSPGRAWVACQEDNSGTTLFSYDGREFERAFSIPTASDSEWPRAVVELRDGSVWVGAFWQNSLFRYANGNIEPVALPPEASTMGVSDIAELSDGRVWIAGRNLVVEHNTSGWRVVQRNLETVRMIYPARDGSIWIAAGAGVMRCRESTCVLHGGEEGLPEGVAWTVVEDSSGRLLVGTTAGVRSRDAGADRDPPKVEISSQLNVAKFAPGGEVRLVPTGMDRWRFTFEDRLLFSYRVDGGVWSAFEDLTVISLKGIRSGGHNVEVRAMDRNFNTSAVASYPFQVLVPWYQQPAWIVSALVASCVLAFSVYQHLNRHGELRRAVESTTQRLKADFEEHSRIQARFESILDHAPTLIYVKNLDGRYLISNLRHCDVFRRSREQIIGKTDDEIFGAESNAPFEAGEAEALAEDRVLQLEETDPRSSKTYLSLKFPLHDATGMPNAICGISTEITEIKQVQERAQTLQRLEAIGLLAGGVAHDFNNLLTIINGYSQLALGQIAAESPLRAGIVQILSAGERAAGLTAQLLAFSRRQVIQSTVLNPGHLVADLEKMLHRLIGEHIELTTRTAPDLGSIRADATQVEQIVMNLVLNARDAMPEGGKLLIETQNVIFDNEYVNQHPDVRPGAYVMIAVSDTGIGMPPEIQARVFEPFFTTKQLGKGTGLGLASVYGMVQQSGGWISVDSEVGRGTTFKVYLPRTDDEAPKAETKPKTGLRGDETILVVEDQPEVRALATTALQRYGYTVYEASSGTEALSYCRGFGGAIHLVVTDIVMPGMNGRELARELAKLRPDLKVLYMSGYTDNAVSQQELIDYENRYMQKPFTPESLAEKVRELLGRKSDLNTKQ
jgi:signal transduction histidine kinase/ActR/RegA family two-component response regulator